MIKVGIAGLGFMGMIHYLAYQRVRGVKVAAICEQNPDRLAGDWRTIKGNFGPQGQKMDLSGISRYSQIEQLLADPEIDLVDVCLPPAAHAGVAVCASKAGKHVFCEKPIALKPADADQMVAAAQKAGKLLMIGHVLPFFPEYRFAYRTIQGGQYGALRGGRFKRIISDPTWLPDFYNPETTGGPMIDLHIHDAHFIRLIAGMPRSVQSVGRMRGEVVEFFDTQFLFDDPGLIITATSGAIGQQGRPFTHGFEIYLEKATLLFDGSNIADKWESSMPLTVLFDEERPGKPKKAKAIRPNLGSGDPVDSFVAELGEVVQCVKTGNPSALLNGQLARDAVVLCQRQTQSVLKRKAVKV
jgi:predicted dehydrogenase